MNHKEFIVVIIAMSLSVCLHAKEFTAATGFNKSHMINSVVYKAINGKLSELSGGGNSIVTDKSEYLSPFDINEALKNNIIDMGLIILPYYQNLYSRIKITSAYSLVGADNRVVAGAMTEYLVNCAQCMEEFKQNNQVFLGVDATTNYQLLSTKPIKTLQDFKGLRVRTAEPALSKLVEKLGAIPIVVPSKDLKIAITNGTVQAMLGSITDIDNEGLQGVIGYVTQLDLAGFKLAAVSNVNRNVFLNMSTEERDQLIYAVQYGQSVGLDFWRDQEEAILKSDYAPQTLKPDGELNDSINSFLQSYASSISDTIKNMNVLDPHHELDYYQLLMDKWNELISADINPDMLAKYRKELIFDKINFE